MNRTSASLLAAACFLMLPVAGRNAPAQESRQATGVKVGEVTPDSAIVWMRATAKPGRNETGDVAGPEGATEPLSEDAVIKLKGACPGAAGHVRLAYGTKEDLSDAVSTPWVAVTAKTDFSHSFALRHLKPSTVYYYAAETAGAEGKKAHKALRGRFETAPPPEKYADVTFTVITGQAYKDIDDAEGFNIYPAMAGLKPKFIVPTGDTVYYDSEPPKARTVPLARHHWQRMYGFPRHIEFHLQVPGYWEKDDHDTLTNDCWPAMRAAGALPLTFAEGLGIFREQVPMGEKTYRTFRWGKGLQIWLVEGRDFRSPNTMPDGPEKTIWGAEQKKWLFDTLRASDADWKVLISPTPIVGPDRGTGKNDNHSNAAFRAEGDEIRAWLQKNVPDNFFVACGDRHWQYHSVHPEAQVQEFSCGPASDQHAGGSPGENQEYHRFHRVKGGFLSVSAGRVKRESRIAFRFHDVKGAVVYQFERQAAVRP
ncbi:MAG: alkaline phosphatase D family protein [Planctomycetia bacterium]|nr:alkaline phosphatase D family protein [Planctomycetia bacterium]